MRDKPKEIIRIQDMTDQQLFEELGEALYEAEAQNSLQRPLGIEELAAKAKTWFDEKLTDITSLICENTNIKKAVTGASTAREKILLIIADAISAKFFELPVFSIAEIILRRGVALICKDAWLKD